MELSPSTHHHFQRRTLIAPPWLEWAPVPLPAATMHMWTRRICDMPVSEAFCWADAREHSFGCHNWSKFKCSLVFVLNWFVCVCVWTQLRFVGTAYILSTWREWIRVLLLLSTSVLVFSLGFPLLWAVSSSLWVKERLESNYLIGGFPVHSS